MGGLVLLLLLGLYGWISYKVIHAATRPVVKLLVIAAVVLIPTADAIYGRIKLKQMCKAEGGLRLEKTADHVEGFYEDSFLLAESWITRFNFHFVEGKGVLDGKTVVYRLTRQIDGKIVLQKGVQKESKYALRNPSGNPSDVYMRIEHVVETVDGADVLGRLVVKLQ